MNPYVYVALRRDKDNDDEIIGPFCLRQVDYQGNEQGTINQLIARTREVGAPGKWRIYRSVNRRDIAKAELDLLIELGKRMNDPDLRMRNIETTWKSILMAPKNRAEDYLLLDVDDNASKVIQLLEENNINIQYSGPTPNGMHFVISGGSLREIREYCEVKRDSLLFISRFDVE